MDLEEGLRVSSFLGKPILGLELDIRLGFKGGWSTGFYMTLNSKRIDSSFYFQVGKPLFNVREIAWSNQFELKKTKYWTINAGITTGLHEVQLTDESIKVVYPGNTRGQPKIIRASDYLMVQPSLTVAYRFYSTFYVYGKAEYRRLFGIGRFGEPSYFEGFTGVVGIRISSK